MNFSKILTILRESNDLSRKELAERLNLSYSILSKYENNERFPSHDILIKIADYFDVSIDYLLGRSKILKIVPVPEMILNISDAYCINYTELMKFVGYIDKIDECTYNSTVHESSDIEYNLENYISYISNATDYFTNKRIYNEIMDLSDKSKEDLQNYIKLLKLQDKESGVCYPSPSDSPLPKDIENSN